MRFGSIIKYSNKLDFLVKVIDLYLTVNEKAERLLTREKEALAYYMMYGMTEETIRDVETGLSKDIKPGYVRMINSTLKKKGYIIVDDRNYKKKYLSDEMEALKKHFVDEKGKTFTIGFVKK